MTTKEAHQRQGLFAVLKKTPPKIAGEVPQDWYARMSGAKRVATPSSS